MHLRTWGWEADLPEPPGEHGEGNAYGHWAGSGEWHDDGEGGGHWDHGHHGHLDPQLGISDAMAAQSRSALEIAACPGNPRDVRSAAVEALGLARDPASREFLELMYRESVEPDDAGANLFLRTLSGRSLTSISGNNHLADSDLDETLGLFLDAWNAQEGAP